MKYSILFLLALTACGPDDYIEESSEPSEESVDAGTEATEAAAFETEKKSSKQNALSDSVIHDYSNDPVTRFLVCNYIPLLIDTNPVTGEGVYYIKWDCPPGFH